MSIDPKDPKSFTGEEDWDAVQAQIDDVLKGKVSPEALAAEAAEEAAKDMETSEDDAPQDNSDAGPALVARIAELESEMAAMKDQALRAMADAENVKKRAEREMAAAKAYAVERFAVDMLSVSDNLGRALLGLDDKAREDMGANAKSLLDGIELTEKELMAVFARHGIKAVPGVGSKFDPKLHQAVAQVPSPEVKGDVANVMQTGFTLGDRTLRAAMVAVSTGPATG